MYYTALGGYQKFGLLTVGGVVEQCLCRADEVCQHQYHVLTFGMCQHFCFRMCLFELYQALYRELLVYVASTVPQEHIAPRNAIYIITQIAVGSKNYFSIEGQRVYNLLGVGRRYHNIGQSLYGSSSIDVRYHSMVGVCFDETLEFVGRTRVCQ